MENNIQVKYKTPKLLVLLNLITLAGTCAVAYLTLYGKKDLLVTQAQINNSNNSQLILLTKQNNDLLRKINQLESKSVEINKSVEQLNPTQSSIILSQVNSLINSASQSIIIYHDTNAAISLLNIAMQSLTASSDPIFNNLKVALTQDISNLSGQDQYDIVVVQTQVNSLNNYMYDIINVESITNEQISIKTLSGSKWDNFKNNISETMSGLFHSQNNLKLSDNTKNAEELINLSMRLKQALLTSNQNSWNQSLSMIQQNILSNYSNTLVGQKILELVKSLSKVSLNNQDSSLDATIKALNKTNQLYNK